MEVTNKNFVLHIKLFDLEIEHIAFGKHYQGFLPNYRKTVLNMLMMKISYIPKLGTQVKTAI